LYDWRAPGLSRRFQAFMGAMTIILQSLFLLSQALILKKEFKPVKLFQLASCSSSACLPTLASPMPSP
jgi:hypothetical protein